MGDQVKREYVTIVIHRDGMPESRTVRLPIWLVRAATTAAVTVTVLVLLGAALYAPIIRLATRVPGLQEQVEQLTAENAQVMELARSLEELEERYTHMRGMLGGDVVPPRRRDTDRLPLLHPVVAAIPGERRYHAGPSPPQHWPFDDRGVITRGQVYVGGDDETHPGIDIAVPMATPIRASGGGIVTGSGYDTVYGLFVVIDHPDGFQTVYGHASRVLVAPGDMVDAGQVIALSGSSGRSTGPHLHFEIRRDGQSIDPLSLLNEER